MSTPKDNPAQSRFWDQFNVEDLKTTSNFKAKFGPTKGGGSNAWPNKRVKISAQIMDKTGKSFIEDIAIFYISKVVTSLNDPTAELQLHALSKPLQKVNAEKVKNGSQWWENVPISFLINRLLESVYKGEDGQLSEKLTISRQDLAGPTEEGDHQLWNLGVPPNWDGTTFQPSLNANPVTAMVNVPGTAEVVVGLGGFNENKAELWRYDVTEDIWAKIGENSEFEGPIQSLIYNGDQSLVYGVCWDDPTKDEREGERSGHKWLAPDAKLFWVDPLVSGQILDDAGNSTDIEDFFPGIWDVREMFPLEHNTGFDLPENSTTPGEMGPFLKDDFKASVGNFEAVEQITLPIPGGNFLDSSKFPLIDDQGYAYENDILGKELFIKKDFVGIEAEVKTVNGQTQWIPNPDAIYNGQIFTGSFSSWSSDGNSVSFTSLDSTFSTTVPVNIKYAHRLRITGFTGGGWSLSVIVQVGGVNTAIIVEQSLDPTLQDFYLEIPEVSSLENNLGISGYQTSLLLRFSGPNSTNITIGSISVVPCINARLAHRVGFQAGENIPITNFSKVAVGIYNQKPTNNGIEGPKYDLYNNAGEPFEPLGTNLRAVFFVSDNPDVGFTADNQGAVFRTADRGQTWRRAGAIGALSNINDLYFFNSNSGWLVGDRVGDNGVLARSTNASSINPAPNWSRVETNMGRDIRRIHFFNSEVGWFVGNSGSIYKTTNGGLSWDETITGINQPFTGLAVIDINTVVTIRPRGGSTNGFRIYKTTDQGINWDYWNFSLTPDDALRITSGDILFTSSSIGFFAGSANSLTTAGGNNFALWKTTNGGQNWTRVTNYLVGNPLASLGSTPFITRIRAINNYVYFTTSQGRIYRYNDNNSDPETNTELLYSQPEARRIGGLWVINSNDIVAVGDEGLVLRTTDGGQTWEDSSLGWKAEELTLDFNLIAQNRKKIAQDSFQAFNPLFGPAQGEAGISVDNSVRKLIANRFGELTTNDFVMEDVAPAFDYATRRSHPWVGFSTYNADPDDFRSGEAGNGYLSIVARTIGNKGGRWRDSDELPLHGIVRYTNGQQGLFEFVPEADGGNGILLFAQRITDNDPSQADEQYRWGPGSKNHRFKTRLVALKCSDKSIVNIMDLETQDSPNPGNPYNEQTQFPYPIAGASTGAMAFISLVTNPVYTRRFTGDNGAEVASVNKVHKLNLSNLISVPEEIIYDSRGDQSVYNTRSEQDGLIFPGNVTDEYAEITEGPAGPQNRTRKITHLHYSSKYGKLFGSCFRKDSLLSVPNSGELTPPCHEVFYCETEISPKNFNRLTIIDHDVQQGELIDAIKFTGFAEQNDRIWYSRLSSPTVDPHSYQRLARGAQLCYITDVDGAIEGGRYWDDRDMVRTSTLREARGFIAHNKAITSLASVGDPELERSTLLSAFDYYFRRDELTQETLDDIVDRPKIFFKIDAYGLDKRIGLADFRGLTVWDAIRDLANANGYVFGFNKDHFFVTPRDKKKLTQSLSTAHGDIIDIQKEVDEDIRNIVNVSAFSPQLDDGEWEVTHVGRDGQNRPNDLEDERLFNGEFSVSITSPEEGSVLMLCTRRGRLLTIGFDNEAGAIGDASDQIWERNPPMFKWLTHSPSINLILMQDMGADNNELLVNTLYQGSNNPVRPGDIVIFTEQDEMEPVGKVIKSVDPNINLIVLEEPPGFAVDKFTSLSVIRSHLGTEVNSDNHASTVKRWGDKFSDEGIAVIKDVYRGEILGGASNKLIYAHLTTMGKPPLRINKFIEFKFQRPHGMIKGNSFEVVRTGDPDFRFSGEYTVNSFNDSVVIVRVSEDFIAENYENPNTTDQTFLINEQFKSALKGTTLRLNSLNAFRGVRVRPYEEGYRHFNFLITTLPSNAITRTGMPNTNIESETEVFNPIAYVHSINFDSMEISLGPGDYRGAFEKGDVLNAHYILSPIANKDDSPPYMGLSQQVPGGFANWRWIAEPDADLFNVGDVARLKFGGSSLEKDASSTYSLVDSKSLKRWGESDFTYPDNRFIEHNQAINLARMIIRKFSEPGLKLNITMPYTPGVGFLTNNNQNLQEIGVIDQSMFGSMPGFKVTGTLRRHEVDLDRAIMEIEIVTNEKY